MSEILISEASLSKTFALKDNACEKIQHLILQLILYVKIHFRSEIRLDIWRQASFVLALGFMSFQLLLLI
jgi:hypothetical protein